MEIDSDEEGLAVVDATVLAMVDSRTILDENMAYFDTRLSPHQPTLKVRIADVCLRCEDAVLLAALVRALVETAARAWRAGEPRPRYEWNNSGWRHGVRESPGSMASSSTGPADHLLPTWSFER